MSRFNLISKFLASVKKSFFSSLFPVMLLFALPFIAVAQGKIVFVTHLNTNSEIAVMNPDGTGRTTLYNNSFFMGHPVFSPDGSKIAFMQRQGIDRIYVMNSNGSNLMPLTSNLTDDQHPSFSPDGSKIAFVSNRDGLAQIYVMNADGTNQIRLANAAVEVEPSFGPDGRIVFSSSSDLSNITRDIYVMNADGSNRTRLTTDGQGNSLPKFSPDGSKIVFASFRDGNYEIYIMNSDGSNQTRLTNNSTPDIYSSFSPDGSKISFRSSRAGDAEIFVMNADGTNQTQITNNSVPDEAPFWGSGLPANSPPTITALGATVARASNTPNTSIATVNDAEDTENSLAVTINGNPQGATVNGVTVSGIAVSPSGNVTANVAATCGATNASFTLQVIDSGSLFGQATLNVGVTNETTAPTLTLPSNIVTDLPLNSTDTSKVINFTVSATDNCDPNPTVTAVPPSGSAFPVGTTIVNVTATDASGNTATGSFTVTVQYNFAGFFRPIENLPMVNLVNAGQSIPVKFSLSGDKGLNIFAPGYPLAQQIPCGGGGTVLLMEETETAGSSTLSYNAATDQYIYVWKTEMAWSGTCWQLIIRLNDGSLRTAHFQFK
jgi:Tol biopolymer transport system component